MAESLKVPKKAPGQYPKPPEGSWTEHYPELDTESDIETLRARLAPPN